MQHPPLSMQPGGATCGSEEEEGEEPKGGTCLYVSDQSERNRVSGSRHAGQRRKGEGLRIRMQLREEPIRTRLQVGHSDVVKIGKNREKGGKESKQKVGAGLVRPQDYQPHLSVYGFSLDVYGQRKQTRGEAKRRDS